MNINEGRTPNLIQHFNKNTLPSTQVRPKYSVVNAAYLAFLAVVADRPTAAHARSSEKEGSSFSKRGKMIVTVTKRTGEPPEARGVLRSAVWNKGHGSGRFRGDNVSSLPNSRADPQNETNTQSTINTAMASSRAQSSKHPLLAESSLTSKSCETTSVGCTSSRRMSARRRATRGLNERSRHTRASERASVVINKTVWS